MSTTIRPDNLRAALDAKIAAALSQLVELREAEQPRVTPHLNPHEIVGAFLVYARGVFPIAHTFGNTQAGELRFNAWYQQWRKKLSHDDRGLWEQLRNDQNRLERGQDADLIDVEISVAADPSISGGQGSLPRPRVEVRKCLVRFTRQPKRPASSVCDDYLRLAKRFAADFAREYQRFLP